MSTTTWQDKAIKTKVLKSENGSVISDAGWRGLEACLAVSSHRLESGYDLPCDLL